MAGLAPARSALKGRSLELLCIRGHEVVVLEGIAPSSSGYQPGALLLSYRTVLKLVSMVDLASTMLLNSRPDRLSVHLNMSDGQRLYATGNGGRQRTCTTLLTERSA